MRTPLDALLTRKTLEVMSAGSGHDAVDALLDDSEQQTVLPIKNVCAKVSEDLSDDIDRICSMLGIRKRAFLEAAFIEAVQKADQIMEAEGLEDHLVELTARLRGES